MRLHRNRKALSPIFATLILIAIAVIAGVVVYMFTSGFLAGMTNPAGAGQERITVQGASYSTGTVTVYAQSTGGPEARAVSIIVKDVRGNTVDSKPATNTPTIPTNGTLTSVSAPIVLTEAGSYTATLVTAAGGSFVSPSFTVTG